MFRGFRGRALFDSTFSMKSSPLFGRAGTASLLEKIGSRLRGQLEAVGVARFAWISCVVSILALVAGVALNRQADLLHTTQEIDARLRLNVNDYSKFVGLTITIIDQQLVELRTLQAQGKKMPSQQILNGRLGAVKGLLLQVEVVDAAGLVIDSSESSMRRPVNVADLPYFRAVRDSPRDELYIGPSLVGRLANQFSLQLVRPIRSDEGRFAGAIVVTIDPQRLHGYFSDLKLLDQQGVLAIIGKDGIARFRLSSSGFSVGQDFRAIPQWGQISTRRDGMFEGIGVVDDVERRLAYHAVEGYPLVVLLGTGLDDEMEDFCNRTQLIVVLSLILALVLLLVANTVSRLTIEQKRSYALLVESSAREVESNVTKSNFLASVSHELRTPLNSILGFSEMIRDTAPSRMLSEYAALIHQSGMQLFALVNTILDLARIESGKMGLTVETVNVPELLQTLTAVYQVQAEEKKLALSLTLHPGGMATVESDRTKLVQVLHNVIDNAIKFTPAGAISVALKPVRNGLRISVVDSGVGMSAARLGQAFERFNTNGVAGTADEGAGLGLKLCRELLRLMSGTIDLVSQEGRGTTVEIFIPYVQLSSEFPE